MSATNVQFTVAAHIMAALGFRHGEETPREHGERGLNCDERRLRTGELPGERRERGTRSRPECRAQKRMGSRGLVCERVLPDTLRREQGLPEPEGGEYREETEEREERESDCEGACSSRPFDPVRFVPASRPSWRGFRAWHVTLLPR